MSGKIFELGGTSITFKRFTGMERIQLWSTRRYSLSWSRLLKKWVKQVVV
jgi:hypothetical protein